MCGYAGFSSEGEYHEYYTLHGLLEREKNRSERTAIKARIREIKVARRSSLAAAQVQA